MLAAVRTHDPELIACPMLTTMIPEQIWSRYRCLIVHPGPIGDRGPSSLDWAIELESPHWGVTILEANAEFDAGTPGLQPLAITVPAEKRLPAVPSSTIERDGRALPDADRQAGPLSADR